MYQFDDSEPMMEVLVSIADAVMDAVRNIPRNVDLGEEICMGADGTPTSQVDKIAENTVLMYIASHKVPLNVLSEEIGFVDNGAKDTLILDPIDGTRNAVLGIPVRAADAEKGVTIGSFHPGALRYYRELGLIAE